jgi:hypothetical protein
MTRPFIQDENTVREMNDEELQNYEALSLFAVSVASDDDSHPAPPKSPE